nr:transposase [Bifidobacterium breve]
MGVVTGNGARWIDGCVFRRRPQTERILDGFHIVSRAADALDKVRTAAWREARRSGTARKGVRDPIKGARWALLKNESDLNAAQRARLEYIANTNETLWTAYKLKERLGMILRQGRGCGRAPAAPVGRGRIPVRHRGILKTRREDRTAPLRHPIRGCGHFLGDRTERFSYVQS